MLDIRRAATLLAATSSLAAIASAASGQSATPVAPVITGDVEAPAGGDIVVLGSRIPRVTVEGPAPVTVISSDDILKNGYQSVPDLLRAITQNGGETQSQQSASGASFTPGAQQVDLRGLGPNHTLVLVNGRRIADFPLPFKGQSNFTDISNIPVGLIERVEVLSGSASAIYGSDAISGVVNFQLKQKADGTRIDLRLGDTQHGGGASQRLSLTSGWDTGAFHGVVGIELLRQKPLWEYQRKRQDSTADNPTTEQPLARRTFLRTDQYTDYIDPGAATCAKLANLNGGTTYYASRPGYDVNGNDGYFCGSNESVGYGTMISSRKSLNSYASLGYTLSDHAELFADLQFSYSKLKLFRDVLDWYYETPDGNEEGTFYNKRQLPENTYDGSLLDNWYRQFTPEEMGGLGAGMTRNRSITFNITPGIKGRFGRDDKWSYEVSYNHAEYRSRVAFPEVVIDKANAFFLGPQLGVDPDSGYPIFDADPARLYTPLTPAEYRSITQDAIYRPKSRTDNFSATLNTTELFHLPAGPVGFAAIGEIGSQGYNLRPDPLALGHYYVGLTDSTGKGSRRHWGLGYEFRVPVFSFLQIETAGRYDHYRAAGNGFGKFTYNAGAELRPTRNLLFRAAYGTGFRAPDLHYVFSGPGDTHPSGTDYYLCRTLQPDVAIGDCDYSDEGIVSHRTGNRALKPETSKSLNAGVVWQPTRRFDVSVDYFRVALRNEVLDMQVDSVLRDEADCLLGQTAAGTPVDPNSPTCLDAIARVQRYGSGALQGRLQGVYINPINVAKETTDGIDIAAHMRFPTRSIGEFSLSVGYTYVFNHTTRQYPGDPTISKLAYDSDYDIPRDKGTASLSWSLDKLSATIQGQRLGRLPNYDEDRHLKATYLFNLSAQYDVTDHARISFTVDNLFDQGPQRDSSYASYPYYDISWFDGVGRSFYLQLTYKLGGAKL
ncbi:TonB-dependent receptor domain-containing protein [Flavisphingomonas formosensis]|uniref:TonB-dependent receptor domain-containing protein n=1 Tax=Flavisphingomonas formosensis TaxID=861534 RepID=UPI0012F8563F|nr:TonB-dependent receptor [Sphingomonas formosensis]